MTKDGFDKLVLISYGLAVLCGITAIYIFMNGIPNFEPQQKYRDFCISEGGDFIERNRDTYNEDLCGFVYESHYSRYAMSEVTNEKWAKGTGHKMGEICFVCWDELSCRNDALIKIDNGTRRYTRC